MVKALALHDGLAASYHFMVVLPQFPKRRFKILLQITLQLGSRSRRVSMHSSSSVQQIRGDDANLGNTIEIRLTSAGRPYWIPSQAPKVGFHTVSARYK
jgi:hypothetical protein